MKIDSLFNLTQLLLCTSLQSAESATPDYLAYTPDLFPDLMAAAIQSQDIGPWTANQGMNLSRTKG